MINFNNLKTKIKLAIIFGAIAIVVLTSGLVVGAKISSVRETAQWNEHTYIVLKQLEGMIAGMVNQETGVRGYLVSGNKEFLAPYHSGRSQFDESFKMLKDMTSDNPAQQKRLDEALSWARKWQSEIAEREILNTDLQQARDLEASGAGKGAMDAFRAKIAEIIAIESDLLSKRGAAQKSALDDAELSSRISIGAVIFLSCVFALLLLTGIANPIKIMTGVMTSLAAGELTTEVPYLNREDEVGAMARSTEHFRQGLLEARNVEAAAARQKEEAEQQRKRDMHAVADNFEQSVKSVVEAVSSNAHQMQGLATSLSASAEQTTRQATTVASATEQTSNAVQTVAAAAEELSASIREIGRQVTESSSIANAASGDAGKTNVTVRELADTVSKIGDVVTLINVIASQTNLLALNATIEAARAGEAGKGFAVVAGEVKSLANQTARATDEIRQQITTVQTQTQNVVEAISLLVKRIDEISHISTVIASAVEEQSAATSEIAGNVSQAAQGANLVASSIGGVSDAASSTGTASQQALSSAQSLSREAEQLKGTVTNFLNDVRSA